MSSGFNLSDQTSRTWQQRADLCAAMIIRVSEPGKRISLADVGCGDMKLLGALQATGIALDYSGFDLRPQFPQVTTFELGRDRLNKTFDVVAILGVLEYVQDYQFALETAIHHGRHFVFSLVPSNLNTYTAADVTRLGWQNYLSEQVIDEALARIGASVLKKAITPDGRTMLWLCASYSSETPQGS